MIGNARVARNKECCPTGFQLAPFPAFVVLIYGHTWQWRVTPRQSIRSAIELCLFEKKKQEEEEEEEGKREKENGERWEKEKRKEKKSEVCRYLACCFLLRSISMYKWAANRNAANRHTRFLLCSRKEGREKGRGGRGEGIIANRKKYEFAPDLLFFLRRKLWRNI